MPFETIRVEVDAHVATVTLDRPRANLLSPAVQDELTRAFDSFTDRADVRCAILTGAGSVFCGGLDLKARAREAPEPGASWRQRRAWRECTYAIMECKVPVIAAINGPALGAGLALVASCDILVASTGAELGLPEIDVGLLGGARRAMRLFGHSRLRRMVYLGHRIPGEELMRLGIVEDCVAPDRLMEAAMAYARGIAAKSPRAIRLAKLGIGVAEELSLRSGYRFEQDLTDELSGHPDSTEALRAFVEKRRPVFGDDT